VGEVGEVIEASDAFEQTISILEVSPGHGSASVPSQGTWSEAAYVELTNRTNRLIEFSDGVIEALPMPTQRHQMVLLTLYRVLFAFVTEHAPGGVVLLAPLRVRLWEGKIREPDLMVMLAEHADRRGEAFWEGADLVMEVVSPDDPRRDLVQKREEYARGGIPEYWIVNPQTETITVLWLEDGHYQEPGTFPRGAVARSVLLAGLEVEVNSVFAQV
jgi:Uma2 family endonuclease